MSNKENIMLWRDRKSAGTGKEQDDFQPYMEVHLLETERPLWAIVNRIGLLTDFNI